MAWVRATTTSRIVSAGRRAPACRTRSTRVSSGACWSCAVESRTAFGEPTMSRPSSSAETGQTRSVAPARRVIARGPNGQPRTYRLAPATWQHTAHPRPGAAHAAYRRLAAAILRLDVATLADELR